MANHRIDPRRVKIHFAYSVAEAAKALGTHRNTIRSWIKQGLPVADDYRPVVMSGAEIRSFLQRRRSAKKQPLGPGKFYCFKCRCPKSPAGGMADFLESPAAGLGTLCGLCPDCTTLMHRRTSLANLEKAKGKLDVMIFPGSSTLKRDAEPHS